MQTSSLDLLLGDATKAREKLGWEPKVSFKELVKVMAESDVKMVPRELTLKVAGLGNELGSKRA